MLINSLRRYLSPYRKIGSSWKVAGQSLIMNVQIPVNTTAEIWVPLKYGEQITEGGKAVSAMGGTVILKKENGYSLYEVGSGSYSFSVNR